MFNRLNEPPTISHGLTGAPPLVQRPPMEKATPAKPAITIPPVVAIPCQCEPLPLAPPAIVPPVVAEAMHPAQHVLNSATLRLLATLEEQGIDVGHEAMTASVFMGRLTVVVTVTRNDDPSKIAWKLPKLHREILAVLNHDTPRKADWIAVKLHKANSGMLRSTLSQMVSFGIIRKSRGRGYLLT